ncbi:outer membrane protein assembly factor BamE [Methylobrevis pamukkalensis]|uniref:Outer membrane protein assembly factor BamE n=1 Tax=Methylobrevis pamukkalensis TaxID=1439726 RepID=A0A1E3H4S2_9HYPH|nr:outer membrane protein assembly factor BamE [Methylobrevis pamukkalensis]ODN71337.1 Outer membrane protein assembly factor BamE [Methylobrevis pamukkalensis]
MTKRGLVKDSTAGGLKVAALALVLSMSLAACGSPPRQHGFVMPENALEQVPVGSSEEQVLLVLGTPSTTSTLSGKTYYYITQVIDESPLMGRSITDQRVLAVYFDESGAVREIAQYGLQDGKVFDFISRRTRTSGQDLTLVGQILGSSPSIGF